MKIKIDEDTNVSDQAKLASIFDDANKIEDEHEQEPQEVICFYNFVSCINNFLLTSGENMLDLYT